MSTVRPATRRFSILLALVVASAVGTTAGSASPTSFPGPAGKIAITLVSSGTEEPGIRVMNPDGSGLTRIPAAGGFQPVWSADGRWLAYTTFPNPWVIRVVRADGTGDREVLSASSGAPATTSGYTWSPTGAEIAYRCATGLCAVRVSDGTTRRILDVPSRIFVASPAWSPDGSRIAFACSVGVGLCLVNADGTNVVGFASQPGFRLQSPDW